VIISDRREQLPRLLAAAAVIAGIAAWIVFLQGGLVLSHYDAKAHLVVARRVLDSITPSWQQVGAVWLPLPHVLNLLPVQIDALYRTGASGTMISIASFGLMAYATARLVLAVTGSAAGAIAAVATLVLNPNLLYLQSTPMSEPLLLGLTILVVLWLYEWVRDDTDRVPRRLGWAIVAAVLTRYEVWAVVGAGIAAAAWAFWRRGVPPHVTAQRVIRLSMWPAVAVALFLLNSRITVGAWFVSGGFYVPDPEYQGRAARTLVSLWWGTHELSGYVLATAGVAAAVTLTVRAVMRRSDAALLVPVSILAAGVVPFIAFYQGHPYRIRYMIPLVGASAILGGIAVGWTRKAAPVAAATLLASVLAESPPWRSTAPMLMEAQWDRPASEGRRRVTTCLASEYRGDKILASMASLAHYMQELSAAGLHIADFIHEGNGAIWNMALETGPALHAGWMLVEEQAEGGDILAQRIARTPAFAEGMVRVCEGGGVALYKRHSGHE